jgi:hypothetical protein
MVREGIEDWGRHKSDKEMNRSKCKKYKGKACYMDDWKNLQVGDIV